MSFEVILLKSYIQSGHILVRYRLTEVHNLQKHKCPLIRTDEGLQTLHIRETVNMWCEVLEVYRMKNWGWEWGWTGRQKSLSAGQFPYRLKVDSSRFSLWSFHSEAPVGAVSHSPLSRVSQATWGFQVTDHRCLLVALPLLLSSLRRSRGSEEWGAQFWEDPCFLP